MNQYLFCRTHAEPTPKMQIKLAFWILGICNFKIIGIGNTSRSMSVAMFSTAVAMYNGVRFRQVPSVMKTSKFFITGVQVKIKGNTKAMLYPITRNMLI
jgi:hypothetical protein